ncbi:hypothetical protein HBI56_200350 [Parastagonospora nodorum]|uniref:Uncharacterized protein n=2 Tax=Phaeosphaeria nodorum (strain SN15 / ATCC MYA-4574 / FGSC 10173) TaxID=321614 RepID=A0A7U2EXR7_PHANO|nr:hypothetical protein SNOG_15682 [Parastagonospora nodorum SN15]KAH3905531.1 hypothetical protein HBH56_214890 [Parastagonospora nodorum]EAT77057.1 hypothetical protein SNOG_15682 [Parastagonospora nodorum SN15]KAH3922673.1 hypothetical protein HBH54_222610 [Parastagonospora nodorum]KAH3942082.1 hypothetical protein HBH53_192520 [Parastagonospora nodorum]KAH3961288.1 hypothetical protein HBH51_183580 [Parastagonospora nodorum]
MFTTQRITRTKNMKTPTQSVNVRYLISPEMSPTDIAHRYYRRLRKYHLEKNGQLADGPFKTAHMQYIDDCDYLWELAGLHFHIGSIPSPGLRQIFGWVLSTFVVLVMQFCHDKAATMVQKRMLPIYRGDAWRVWRFEDVQPMPSAAMAESDREKLRRNELPN